jgi:Prp8 binding protein
MGAPRSKKARTSDGHAEGLQAHGGRLVVAEEGQGNGNTTKSNGVRSSSLLAPTMLLAGHLDQVTSVRFSPSGNTLASGSHDKKIFLWNAYGECENYSVLSGHKNAVLSVCYADDGEQLVSCSPDLTVRAWDVLTGEQIGILREHTGVVNCCAATSEGPVLVASASDDASVKLWDARAQKAAMTLVDGASDFPLCAVAITEKGEAVYAGGIDNVVKGWDLRKNSELSMRMEGHQDSITGVDVSPSGSHVLTNSMDMTMRSWDIRPFAEKGEDKRCVRVFTGHQHGNEKNLLRCSWSEDGKKVSGGSSDSMVHIWDVASGDLVLSLPGHHGSVNEVRWRPVSGEKLLCSASSDRTLYLGGEMM